MRIFLGAKFFGADNREKLEEIRKVLTSLNFEVFIGPVDIDNYGEIRIHPKEFMERVFKEISKSDIVMFEHETVSTGVGIEAGYAKSLSKKIIVIYPKKYKASASIEGVSNAVVHYNSFEDLKDKLRGVLWKLKSR